jgi:putative oxidoreductase
MNALANTVARQWTGCARWLDRLHPLIDLLARLYVAQVFVHSGLSKIGDWESTLYLFREEYHVPLLPPELAAVFATTGELVLPVLLVLGIFTRFSALGLFVLNAVAVMSYYSALLETPAGLHDHVEWGLILALLFSSATGALTLDRLVLAKWCAVRH